MVKVYFERNKSKLFFSHRSRTIPAVWPKEMSFVHHARLRAVAVFVAVRLSYSHTINKKIALSIGTEAAMRAALFSSQNETTPLSLGFLIGLNRKL